MQHTTEHTDMKQGEKSFLPSDGLCTGIFNRILLMCKYETHLKQLASENTVMSHNKVKLEEQITILVSKLEAMEESNKSCKDELIIRDNEVVQLQNQIKCMHDLHDNDRARLSTLEQQCIDNKCVIDKYEQQTLILEHQLETSEENIQQQQTNLDSYIQKYTDCVEYISKLEHEIISHQQEIDNAIYKENELEWVINNRKDESKQMMTLIKDYERKLNISEQRIQEHTQIKSSWEQQLDSLNNKLMAANKRVHEQQNQLDQLKEEIMTSEAVINDYCSKLSQYKCGHIYTNEQYVELQQMYNELQQSHIDIEAQRNAINRQLASASKLNSHLNIKVSDIIDQHTNNKTRIDNEDSYYQFLQLHETYDRC